MGITPVALLDRPELEAGDLPYLDGFRSLNGSRAYGQFGPMPISIADVHAYLMLVGEDRVEERLRFLSVMQGMDGVFLKTEVERSK